MIFSRRSIALASTYSVLGYGTTQALRLLTNIVLTRLLAPELFGIMVLVNSIRLGFELVLDLGIGQNVIQNKNANEPEFYTTAWTIQVVRGGVLTLISVAAASPIAHFFELPILTLILPIAALNLAASGCLSMGLHLAQKNLLYKRTSLYQVAMEFVAFVAHVLLAYINPTIWALVLGGLLGGVVRTICSYFVQPGIHHKLAFNREYAGQIFSYGKWIFLASIVFYASTNFDRLYLSKIGTLEMLGIYSIARSLAEILSIGIAQLGGFVIFPMIAAAASAPRAELRAQVAPMRGKLLAVTALGLSLTATGGDLVVNILYDSRYQAAGPMITVMMVGIWFSILSSLGEASILGFGRPRYGAFANLIKLAVLLVALPLGFWAYGFIGAIAFASASEFGRYLVIQVGMWRENFSFLRQDAIATVAAISLTLGLSALRWYLGFGASWDGMTR